MLFGASGRLMKHTIILDEEHRRSYSEAIRDARLMGDNQFQGWFDGSENVHQAIVRGCWDLTTHILTPIVHKYTENPEDKSALEIGYGGGKILNAICSYFNQVIGIDIHEEQEEVGAFLRAQGKSNFKLIRTLGRTIDIKSETVNFIYSLITFQHLPSFGMFESYITEAYRCLKAGGIAQLYFGKYSRLGLVDRLRFFIQGYKEITDAKPNQLGLVIRVSKAKEVCRKAGFEIIDVGTSYRRKAGEYPKAGKQNYLTLLKREL